MVSVEQARSRPQSAGNSDGSRRVIHHGDCVEVMAGMEPESVDAIVTDPPYGLEFMGKSWDRLGDVAHANRGTLTNMVTERGTPKFRTKAPAFDLNSASQRGMQTWHEAWAREALRVAKPGAYLLAFGGTRTVHRLACAIEDAGWIIRDTLVWAYAQGFPKSKASLKPAWEPIVMARKPGPLRELAIGACRIPTDGERIGGGASGSSGFAVGYQRGDGFAESALGRWPANVILTDPIFDGGIEGVVGGGEARAAGLYPSDAMPTAMFNAAQGALYGDTGTYSRFFLVPKADRADREPVLGGLPLRRTGTMQDDAYRWERDGKGNAINLRTERENTHPTVKPTELMRHLVRLVTPTGGVVLDPFAGSGSTLIAAEMEGFAWIGIEKEAEYVAIAEARLNGTQRGLGLSA
jgi:DNA modification methylase